MATVSPLPEPFQHLNTSSKFSSPMLQPYVEQPEEHHKQQLQPQQAAVEQVDNDPKQSHVNPCFNHKPISTLYSISFNQNGSCFAIGTNCGISVYSCDPFCEMFQRYFDNGGGIGIVEMLFRSNILVFVGSGDNPQYPRNKVIIWDDHLSRCIGELRFRSSVRGVRLRRDCIVVILEQKIYIYNFADVKLVHQIETISNPKGLCEISQTVVSPVLVCPGLQNGQVRVEHFASKRTKFIFAHDSRIASFALSHDGHLLATASIKGTRSGYLAHRTVHCCRSFIRCKFDPASGKEMTQLEIHNFLKSETAS
ncbi:unnamed protein product [Withania somnifera]